MKKLFSLIMRLLDAVGFSTSTFDQAISGNGNNAPKTVVVHRQVRKLQLVQLVLLGLLLITAVFTIVVGVKVL